MASLWSNLTVYAEKWNLKEIIPFTEEEIASVKEEAVVVDSEYGLSACFFMLSGGQVYIPMSRDSKLSSGETFKVSECSIEILSKPGHADIMRIIEK